MGRVGNFQNFSANKLKWMERIEKLVIDPLQLETGEYRVNPKNCEQKNIVVLPNI